MIKRSLEDKIRAKIGQGKVIILYGPRQVGKTTLIKKIFGDKSDTLWLDGDNPPTHTIFDSLTVESAALLVKGYKTLVIDEAQRIKDIGLKLKILQDNFGDHVQIVATGSSSFDLANKVNEPLTGRKWVFHIFPLTIDELTGHFGYAKEKSQLENRLIYGSYPDIVTHPESAEEIIRSLANDNLYKDILNLGEIIKTDRLEKILKALAFQLGSQVSLNEIAGLVGLDRKTVDSYIALLEQSFIIFRLPSFAKNLRNELKASNKYYFYDIGIRNALIGDFRPIEARSDIGAVFENYIISEFKKYQNHKAYFWRTAAGQEVDYVAIKNTELFAAEVKWTKTAKLPKTFTDQYSTKSIYTLNRENYLEEFLNNKLDFLK